MRAFAGLTLTLALLLCTGCSGGAQSINQSGGSAGADDNSGTASVTYRFAGTMPESHYMSKAMAMVADEMSQKTDGKIKFDMYYSNSLYKDAEMVEVVPEGAVEIVQTNLGQWTGVVPEISIFNMHTIFRDNEHFLAVQVDQEMFDVIDKALQEKANCKLLAWIDFGQNTILSKKPISTMEDLKGKVIRCDSEYITVPIFYPLIKSLGFDGIWFAVLIVVNMELAFITPPVGLNLFVVKGLDKESSMADIIRSVLPFIDLMAIFMVIVALVPPMSTWLPSTMGYGF